MIRCLAEGNSINSAVRMTGVAEDTVLKLLVERGAACSGFLDVTRLPPQNDQPRSDFTPNVFD